MAHDITAASWSPGMANFTHADGDPCGAPGDDVVVAGVTPAAYNGTWTLAWVGPGYCGVVMTDDPGPYESGGTIEEVP